jgi:hypothetical protein
VQAATAALISTSLMEELPGSDGQITATTAGRTLLTTLRSKVSQIIGPAYGAITPEDSATTARVLATITAKLNEELAKF